MDMCGDFQQKGKSDSNTLTDGLLNSAVHFPFLPFSPTEPFERALRTAAGSWSAGQSPMSQITSQRKASILPPKKDVARGDENGTGRKSMDFLYKSDANTKLLLTAPGTPP